MSKAKNVNNVAIFGILGNILLLIAKLTIGFVTKSQAMIADGLNSAGDVFASFMTYIGNKISSQPEDTDHPFGHGKAEYVFSMIISFSLILVAISIFQSSLNTLINGTKFTFSIWLIIVSIGTIIIKFMLYLYSISVGRKYKSLLAIANAEDHRNDIFISSLTLLSIITGFYNLYIIDSIAGLLIALWIGYTGFKIFLSSYDVLMDKEIEGTIKDELEDIVSNIEGVDHIDSIHAKPVGLSFLLIVKVSVDANLTVLEGHNICEKIEQEVSDLPNIQEALVHLNPTQYHP